MSATTIEITEPSPMSRPKRARITYPEGTVRSREQIIAQATTEGLIHGGRVWHTCWNCGGTGRYPSSMLPPGQCRLYCWLNRTPETFGKLAYSLDKYVKAEQARDRRGYRNTLFADERAQAAAARHAQWEAERQERRAAAAAERAERERVEAERKAADLAEKATRTHVGMIGERVRDLPVMIEKIIRLEGRGYARFGTAGDLYLIKMRDANQNAITWFTEALPCHVETEHAAATLTATVKKHDRYDDEPTTQVTRAKVVLAKEASA